MLVGLFERGAGVEQHRDCLDGPSAPERLVQMRGPRPHAVGAEHCDHRMVVEVQRAAEAVGDHLWVGSGLNQRSRAGGVAVLAGVVQRLTDSVVRAGVVRIIAGREQ